jgi:hypothetical protein
VKLHERLHSDAASAALARVPRAHASSPLWLVTNEPDVNDLVTYLDAMRRRIVAAPDEKHVFEFSRGGLVNVRTAFGRMIRRGEEQLHRLCELLCETFLDSDYTLQSVVVGEIETTRERFTLVKSLSSPELYSQTDLDLGTRQLRRLRYHDGASWSRAALIANVVEYQPAGMSTWGIHKFISRIKAEEQIWNKVVDSIFDLDQLVRADKQLRHLGGFVKDVFGVKVVVGDAKGVRALHEALRTARWEAAILQKHGVPATPATTGLQFIEVKNYMAQRGRKETGWEAIKSVFRWWDSMFEVQVQPLWNYHQEREHLTRESHAGFKGRREALRNQIASAVPLFGFYRDLLRWLFLSPAEPAPTFEAVEILLHD